MEPLYPAWLMAIYKTINVFFLIQNILCSSSKFEMKRKQIAAFKIIIGNKMHFLSKSYQRMMHLPKHP